MRIHTDTLSYADMSRAAMFARVTFTTLEKHGSKSRDHAFEVILSGESRRHQNGGSDMAATWDQWGVFLNDLFGMDDSVKCRTYEDVEAFDYMTKGRFEDGWPDDAHGDHTFRFSGTTYQQECTKCSAVTRWQ